LLPAGQVVWVLEGGEGLDNQQRGHHPGRVGPVGSPTPARTHETSEGGPHGPRLLHQQVATRCEGVK
jgi:hypothetical protein